MDYLCITSSYIIQNSITVIICALFFSIFEINLFKKMLTLEEWNYELSNILLCANVNILKNDSQTENYLLQVAESEKYMCLRCRRIQSNKKEDLCVRCINVIGNSINKECVAM